MDAIASPPKLGDDRAIRFTGTWREYLPIAATNALLIVCTLGIYRFWATARQRRYLCSRTHVIDDSLEWTGTGKEMFFGFLIVVTVLAPFFLFIQFVYPALLARGKIGPAAAILALFYVALTFFGGFARFRALRYRLSRTYWHGIRGGSDISGWKYGGNHLGRYALTYATIFIIFPWAMTRLWSARWSAMSFGPLRFDARGFTAEGLKDYWGLLYAIPLLLVAFAFLMTRLGGGFAVPEARGFGLAILFIGLFFMFYVVIPLLTLNWFAAYYRNAAAVTRLGSLEFGFDATTLEWLELFLGNIALAVVTLGFGLTYWGYRNWTFMLRHLEIYGVVDLGELTQSTAHAPREAEGFADAFDVGAF